MSKKPVFNRAGKGRVTPNAPQSFTNKLVYFHDIDKGSSFHHLNNMLVLFGEDLLIDGPVNEDSSGTASDLVFGYVLNEPLNDRLGRLMRRENQPLPSKFNFVQVFNAGAETFEFEESHFLTFLMRKGEKENLYPVNRFGDFEALICENWEEAKHVGQNLAHRPNTITLYSQLTINRPSLVGLVRTRNAEWCEAEADIVFNTSAYMRARLAFPKFVP